MLSAIRKNLAAKLFCLLFFFTASFAFAPANISYGAGIPVLDSANLTQNTVGTFEAITQTLKQIEEYQTQLMQYEDQLKNSLAPATQIWAKAQETMNKALALQGQLEQIAQMDGWLEKFGDANYWTNSPQFSGSEVHSSEQATQNVQGLMKTQQEATQASFDANKILYKNIKEQGEQLKNDAQTLQQLEEGASNAQGRMDAMQHGNMFLANMGKQMLQLRSAFMFQSQQHAAALNKENVKNAQTEEADKKVLGTKLGTGTVRDMVTF